MIAGVAAMLAFAGAGLLVFYVLAWFVGELSADIRQRDLQIAAMEDDLADINRILDAPLRERKWNNADWWSDHHGY